MTIKPIFKTLVGIAEWYCIGTVVVISVKGIGELVKAAIDQI